MNVSNLARPAVPIKDQIWYAVKNGDLEEFKRLTKYGNKNPVISVNNGTPLHLAAQYGYLDIVKSLMLIILDPDSKNPGCLHPHIKDSLNVF